MILGHSPHKTLINHRFVMCFTFTQTPGISGHLAKSLGLGLRGKPNTDDAIYTRDLKKPKSWKESVVAVNRKGRWGKWGQAGQRVQTLSYTTSKFWGSNEQHDYS